MSGPTTCCSGLRSQPNRSVDLTPKEEVRKGPWPESGGWIVFTVPRPFQGVDRLSEYPHHVAPPATS